MSVAQGMAGALFPPSELAKDKGATAMSSFPGPASTALRPGSCASLTIGLPLSRYLSERIQASNGVEHSLLSVRIYFFGSKFMNVALDVPTAEFLGRGEGLCVTDPVGAHPMPPSNVFGPSWLVPGAGASSDWSNCGADEIDDSAVASNEKAHQPPTSLFVDLPPVPTDFTPTYTPPFRNDEDRTQAEAACAAISDAQLRKACIFDRAVAAGEGEDPNDWSNAARNDAAAAKEATRTNPGLIVPSCKPSCHLTP